MDLLPPSYEAATGEPGEHNQINSYSKCISPTAPPPQNDEIITVDPDTIPIFPRPYRSSPSSDVQPNNQNLHQEISPKPKKIYFYRNREQKCTPCLWFFIIVIFVVCALVVIIVLIKAKNHKPKIDFSQINVNHQDITREWQDQRWKENEQMIKDIQDRANKVLEDRRNNPYLGNNY